MTVKTEKVHKNLDLLGQLMLNWGLQVLTADPATTYARIYFNSTSGLVRVYNSTASQWEDLNALDTEAIQDIVGAMIVAGNNIDITYNDGAGTLSIDVEALTSGDITDFTTAARAAISVTDSSELDFSYAGGAISAVLLAGAIVNAKLANMANGTIKGRATAGTGAPEDLTGSQVKTILAIVPGDISGFDVQVRTSRLDQMAAPTAPVSMNSQRITLLADPTGAQDAATKAYVDSVSAGLDWKSSVRVATTAAGTLATSFANGQTVDGVVLATGNRILIKDQAAGAENGIYVVTAGAPTRATDADTSAEVNPGMAVFVEQGTVNADTGWVLTNDGVVTLGTTALTFAQFTALGSVTAGAGLTKTGSTLNVGAGTGITVNADDVAINTAVVPRKFSQTFGDAVATDFVFTHNLNTQDIQLEVKSAASPFDSRSVYWEATSANTATVFFPTPPASNELRVTIQG